MLWLTRQLHGQEFLEQSPEDPNNILALGLDELGIDWWEFVTEQLTLEF